MGGRMGMNSAQFRKTAPGRQEDRGDSQLVIEGRLNRDPGGKATQNTRRSPKPAKHLVNMEVFSVSSGGLHHQVPETILSRLKEPGGARADAC